MLCPVLAFLLAPSSSHNGVGGIGSSHDGVGGIGSDSTVIVPVLGHLHVAFHAPFFTPAGRRACLSFNRKSTAQWVHRSNLP